MSSCLNVQVCVQRERERVGQNVCERRERKANVSEKIVCWSVGACMRVRLCVCVCVYGVG